MHRDGLDRGEGVFHAMMEFPQEEFPLFLGALQFLQIQLDLALALSRPPR